LEVQTIKTLPFQNYQVVSEMLKTRKYYSFTMKRKCSNEEMLAEARTELADERTLMAYIRTAIAVIALGLLVIKFFETVYIPIGIILTIFGVIIGIYGFIKTSTRKRRIQKIARYKFE
jgi:uncharacterized membrane protein YidH (DUF202 family)